MQQNATKSSENTGDAMGQAVEQAENPIGSGQLP